MQEPLEVCFIDWQLSRYGSPVLDLHYLISTSTDRDFRQKEYQSLMEHYYRTLSQSIRRLGSNPDKLFSYDDFHNELKKFGNFVLLMGTMMTEMMLIDPKDIPDIDDSAEEVASVDKNLNVFAYNEQRDREYDRRINDLFDDFVGMGYYSC